MPTPDDYNRQMNQGLDALEARTNAFSRLLENQIGHALDGLLTKGAGLQSVMGSLYSNLLAVATQLAVINPALNAVFGSQRSTLDTASGGLASGLTGGLESVFSGLFGGGTTAASAAQKTASPVTVNIQTANAQSFAASQGQVSAAIADAVRRGQVLR